MPFSHPSKSIEYFIHRAAQSGLCESARTAKELVNDADESCKVLHCRHHVLDELLPLKSDTQQNLRKRCHHLTLPEKKGHLSAKNFIIRLLYKETHSCILTTVLYNKDWTGSISILVVSTDLRITLKKCNS